MGSIVLLDDLTINKIAAGEVIERPASVIKELVENSIDAGANNITVEFRNGGISYIRITDNGKGIMPDDMEIAFERHATSKIRVADDLETVKSMGFRGEALASIAAISKVTMQSKTMDQDVGYKVIAEGGKVSEKEEVGCQEGTIIEVENLFYNTPVRYKFLRKDFTEAGYIEDVITRIALIHPEISIKLINTGKTVISTSGNGDLKTVIYNIYGKDIAENIINVNYEYEDIHVSGVIGRPEIARSNRSNQIFFVNTRYVKDKILTSSAEQAFKDKLPAGKFGFLVLNIDINPKSVDVNVHPAKLEVRFEEEQKVFKAVYHAIKDELLKAMGYEIKDELQAQNETIEGFEFDKKIETENVQTSIKEEIKENIENSFNSNKTFDYESKKLFKKFFNKKEDEEKPTLVEQLYQTRKMNIETPIVDNGIISDLNNDKKEEIEEKEVISQIQETQILDLQDVKEQLNNLKQNIQETQVIDIEKINNEIIKTLDNEKYQEKQDNQETQVIDIQDINKEENEVVSQIQETQKLDLNEIKEEQQEENKVEIKPEFTDMYASIFGIKPKKEETHAEEYKMPEPELTTCKNVSLFNDDEDKKVVPNYRYIGIAFSNYIIIEIDKEIYILDQYAANEKIIYNEMKNNYYNSLEKDSQIMLLPDIIELTTKEMDIARENFDMFEKAGFILEEFGENTIKLIGVPSICMELDTKELFVNILNQINKVARTEKEEIEEKFISTLAKNASNDIKIADDKNEVAVLLEKLLVLNNPFVCESGKPVAIKITRDDIEKKFSRR